MMTVHEVSKISRVSIRALHHYDHIGLLPATEVTEAGYRLYDEAALERLQHILLFKALEFPLKDIKDILDSPDFDRSKALEQQIHLLELRKEKASQEVLKDMVIKLVLKDMVLVTIEVLVQWLRLDVQTIEFTQVKKCRVMMGMNSLQF